MDHLEPLWTPDGSVRHMLRLEDLANAVADYYRIDASSMFGPPSTMGKREKHARDMACVIAHRWHGVSMVKCAAFFRCAYFNQCRRRIELAERIATDDELSTELREVKGLARVGRLPIRRSNGLGEIHYFKSLEDGEWSPLCENEGEIDGEGNCQTCIRGLNQRPISGGVH